MARHTTCTTVAGVWNGVGGMAITLGLIAAIGLLTVEVGLALAAFSTAGITPVTMSWAAAVLIGACVSATFTLSRMRSYFFDHRLICLGDDRCALAQVISIEDNGDGDFSMNTVLAPATVRTSETDYKEMFQPKMLVYVDPGLAARGFRLDPKAGRESYSPSTFGSGALPFFHCEIEGTYFDSFTNALIAYLQTLILLAAGALVLAQIFTALGPVGWALWLLIALFIFLALFLWRSLGDDETDSAPAGPIGNEIPSLTGPVITDLGGNSVNLRDYVALIGRPVCDTGHNPKCWDELHPVKGIAKLERWTTTHTPNDIYDKYCAALRDFVDDVGTVKQGLTAVDGNGNPLLTCLEHKAIG